MDTMQLELFLSLSKTLNFTKTANEFYVTQPTVSNYIKSLEAGIGVTLLKRDSHSVSLTPEGREFLNYANQLLTLQSEAETRLRNIAAGRDGSLRAIILTSCAPFFTECLQDFMQSYPDVQVNVDITEGNDMIDAISRGTHDLFFAHEHMLQSGDNLDHVVLDRKQLCLFMPRSMYDKVDTANWATFSPYHFISAPEAGFSLFRQVSRICANRGFTPNVTNYYSRADAIFPAINAGVGFSILPPHMFEYYNCPNVVSVPIAGEDAVIATIAAWKKGANRDVERFLSSTPLSRFVKG